MKNVLSKIGSVICMMLLTFTLCGLPVSIFAAGLSVSASASTIYVGDSVTFTINASGAGYVTVSGAANDTVWLENSSKSYTVTASSPGSITLSASGVLADFETEKDVQVNDSATVTVVSRPVANNPSGGGSSSSQQTQTPSQNETPKEEAPKNSDSSLSALSIKEGKLSPDFKAGTTSYKVTVAEGTTKVNVSAKANNSKSNVTGDGEISVKAGNNKVKVTCTAEDGSTSVYTIDVYVEEKPVTTMELGGKTLNVFENIQGANLDNKAFTKTTVKISGKDIPAWKSEAQNVTLLYLNGEDGDDFYIYDEAEQKVTSIYRPVGVLGKNLIMINVPDELQTRNGMKFTTVEIDKIKFPGWTFEVKAFENYALIYVMDGQGNYAYYQYDKSEQTLQKFSGAAAITQEKYDAYVKDKKDKEQLLMYIIYGLGAGCVILAGLAGYFFFHKKPKQPKHKKIDIEKEDYEERFHIEKDQ